jgi:HlyD family secretion protein
MIRRLLLSAVTLALIAALAWALWPKPVAVETAVIATQAIDVTVEEEGKSRIRDIYTVSAPIGGELLRVALHAGDKVVAGETVVASIRPPAPTLLDARSRRVAEANIQAAASAVELAYAQLKQAEAQAEFLDSGLKRATELLHKGTISQQAFDKAKLDAAVGRADVERAKANLEVQRRALDSAQAALIEGTGAGGDAVNCCVDVKAPVSGEVLRVVTESAQVVAAGTPLVELGNRGDLEVVVDLLSRDAVGLAPGAPAVIDGWGGPPLTAEVKEIDPAAVTKVSALGIEEQRVSTVLRLLAPAEQWQRLGHDFRVTVHITQWHGDNLTAVPLGALFRLGEDWAVFKVDGDRARRQIVTLGKRTNEAAEVSSGLAPGDRVILHPSDAVQDNTKVIY